MKPFVFALMCLSPTVAFADAVGFRTGDGQTFFYVCADEDGLLYPESDPTDTYTLSFDCSVVHDKFGKGEWHYANGGWVIEFGGAVKLGFPRQSPPLDVPDCAS